MSPLPISKECAVDRVHWLEEKIESLFEAVKHGDAEHDAWLKEKLAQHFNLTRQGKVFREVSFDDPEKIAFLPNPRAKA